MIDNLPSDFRHAGGTLCSLLEIYSTAFLKLCYRLIEIYFLFESVLKFHHS